MDVNGPSYQMFSGADMGYPHRPMPADYDSYPSPHGALSPPNFLLTPATAQEAALLGAPTMQVLQYGGAYDASGDYGLHHRHHMGFVREMSPYDDSYPYGTRTIITSDGKRKRRRIITHEQRKAANVRERRRMYHLNEAFDDLRKRVPTFAYEKKLSRIETLKLAVTYIQFMSEMLESLDNPSASDVSDRANGGHNESQPMTAVRDGQASMRNASSEISEFLAMKHDSDDGEN